MPLTCFVNRQINKQTNKHTDMNGHSTSLSWLCPHEVKIDYVGSDPTHILLTYRIAGKFGRSGKKSRQRGFGGFKFGRWPRTDVSTPWRIVSWRILLWRFVIDPPKRQIKVPAKFTGYTVICYLLADWIAMVTDQSVYQRVRQYSLCRDDLGKKWLLYSICTLVLRQNAT